MGLLNAKINLDKNAIMLSMAVQFTDRVLYTQCFENAFPVPKKKALSV
jgi:hypothetical protein